MYSNAFNYVSALALIVSLVLAFTPSFARLNRYFRPAAIFFAGMLVGSVCASLSAQTAVYQLHLGTSQMLLLGAAVIVVIIVLIVILWFAMGG